MTFLRDIVAFERYLMVEPSWFQCPYCGRTWRRGSHAEGFRKAAASQHVAACQEVALYTLGYVYSEYVENARTVKPIAEALPRYQRSIRALVSKRRREGTLDVIVQSAKRWATSRALAALASQPTPVPARKTP